MLKFQSWSQFKYTKDFLIDFLIDIRAENTNEERDEKTVPGPLEPRRDAFRSSNSSNDDESVQMKRSRNKITCVPSLRLNDLTIIEICS